MLTGRLVRVRHARDRIVPLYLNVESGNWLEIAGQLVELFAENVGSARGAVEEEIEELFGDFPGQMVVHGLTKLLQDRSDFEVVSGLPPSELREKVFRASTQRRADGGDAPFDRDSVLQEVGESLKLSADEIDRGLFADLKSEQILAKFKNVTSERLLQRYNVALAQAVLLRSVGVHVVIRNETPQRYRQLFRKLKFHRLLCEARRTSATSYSLQLDGPMSLFTSTHKYGLQLAQFLPTLLLCRDFELRADLLWGAERKPKKLLLTPDDNLVSHAVDSGTYVPSELSSFVELFRKRRPEWEILEETEIHPLGDGFWIPDFRLRHVETQRSVLLEVLGFWRSSSAEQHLRRLQEHAAEPFLLAVSDQLKIDDVELEGLPAEIHRFRQMPLPDEIARLAEALTVG